MVVWYSSENLNHNCKNSYLSLILSFPTLFHSIGNLSNSAFYNLPLSYWLIVWMSYLYCLMILPLSFLPTLYIVMEFIVEVINKMTLMPWAIVHAPELYVFSLCSNYFISYAVSLHFENLISHCHFMIMKVNG